MHVSEINTVKILGNGYLVNGQLSVPAAQGNRHYSAVQEWIGLGNTPEPEFTAQELVDRAAAESLQAAKQARDEALEALTYDLGGGRIIQTRPKDEQNFRTAIELMVANNIPSRMWVMQDDKKYSVTLAELQTALAAGQVAAAAVWDSYPGA